MWSFWMLLLMFILILFAQIRIIHVAHALDEDIKIREKLNYGKFKYYNLGKLRIFFIFYERKKGKISRISFWQTMISYLFSIGLILLAALRVAQVFGVWANLVFIGLFYIDLGVAGICCSVFKRVIERSLKASEADAIARNPIQQDEAGGSLNASDPAHSEQNERGDREIHNPEDVTQGTE